MNGTVSVAEQITESDVDITLILATYHMTYKAKNEKLMDTETIKLRLNTADDCVDGVLLHLLCCPTCCLRKPISNI